MVRLKYLFTLLLISATAFASGGGSIGGGLPSQTGFGGSCLLTNGTVASWENCNSGSGAIGSVGITFPSWFTVTGSPLTSSGTIGVTGTSEPANEVLATPNGSAGAVSPRALVAADIPTLNQNTTGSAASATVASALASTPSQCTGTQFATGIMANGNANCATPSGGGGGTGNVNNGGNAFGEAMSVGTTDNNTFSLLVDDQPVCEMQSNSTTADYPYAAWGTQPQVSTGQTNQYEFYTQSTGAGNDKNYTGLYTETDVENTTDGSGYQQGIYGVVHSDANTGTYALLRNYFMAEAAGNSTITETYGARALTRIFDENYPTAYSTGTITNGYGLEAYAHSTSQAGVMTNATGILISHAVAGNAAGTGTDSATHTAIGLHIQSDIGATGSAVQNNAYAIESDATVPSIFNGQLNLWSNAALEFSDENYHYINVNAPTVLGSTYNLTLPTTIGSANQCLGNTGTAGALGFFNCMTSEGTGTSLVYTSNESKSLAAGSNITITDSGSGTLTIAASGGAGTSVNYGGDSKSSNQTIGLTSDYDLSFITNNTNRLYLTAGGLTLINNTTGSNLITTPAIFGVYDYHTANDTLTETVFDHYFAYYGNSSNSKDGTLFDYDLRPGDPTFTYSGEYNSFVAKAFLGAAGNVGQLQGANIAASNTNSSGEITYANGLASQVLTSAGIIRNATGIQIPDVQAEGTDGSPHIAYGIDVGSNGGEVASGSSVSNTAAAIHIGNTQTADAANTYAIKSDSVNQSAFNGGVTINTSTTRPTCSVSHRGQIWLVQGSPDSLTICGNSTASGYAWATITTVGW